MSYTPSQWITALDLNFSTQTNQTISTNGTYSIGGLSWTKINSTGDATAMAITNGSGLVITPTSTTNIGGSTFNAPALIIPVTTVIPSYTPYMPLRTWIYISSSNEAANFDCCSHGVMIYNTGFNNQFTIQTFRGFNGATNGWSSEFTVLQSNVTETSVSVPQTTRVGVVTYLTGIFSGNANVFTGNFSTTWPTLSSLTLVASPSIPAATSGALASSSTGLNTINSVNFFLSALRDNSSTSFSATIARFRVDYLPFGN